MRKMLKIYCSALAVFFAGGVIFAQVPTDGNEKKVVPKRVPRGRINSPEYKISNLRIEKIRSVIKSKYDQKVKMTDPAVRKSIEEEIGRLVPLRPRVKPDPRTYLDVKKALEEKINAKFPADIKVLRKKAEEEFAAKNPMVKRNSQVTVHYKRGSRIYRFSGRYYGFGLGGTTIRINSRNIPLVDLTEDSLRMFDLKFYKMEQQKYADAAVRRYLRAKNTYADKIINEEYAKVRKKNEQLGYILRNGWEPAKNIVDEYYNEMLELYKIREEEEARKRMEALKNNPADLLPKKENEEEEEEDEEEE